MVKLQETLQGVLDVAEETDQDILSKFNTHLKDGEAFISIIAPHFGVRVSPQRVVGASIGQYEEFGIETAIERIKNANGNPKTLYMLVNSPGGTISSSYKVARTLRKSFKNIVVFIPHIAASGGALIALTGNKIVMGMMSQITPLDPQLSGVPALSVVRGFQYVTELTKNVSEEDASLLQKGLAQKCDAVQIDVAINAIRMVEAYAREILELAEYPKQDIETIAHQLCWEFKLHEEVIHFDQAKMMNIKVVPHTDYSELWDAFRFLLGTYLVKSADKHIIRYWVKKGNDQSNKNGGEKNENKKGKRRQARD